MKPIYRQKVRMLVTLGKCNDWRGGWGRGGGFQVAPVVKNAPANTGDAGDVRDLGSNPGLGRYPGGGPGNPHQYSA